MKLEDWIDTLRNAREEAGLSGRELARRADLSPGYVYRVEKDGNRPSVTSVESWLAACGYRLEIVRVEEEAQDGEE